MSFKKKLLRSDSSKEEVSTSGMSDKLAFRQVMRVIIGGKQRRLELSLEPGNEYYKLYGYGTDSALRPVAFRQGNMCGLD